VTIYMRHLTQTNAAVFVTDSFATPARHAKRERPVNPNVRWFATSAANTNFITIVISNILKTLADKIAVRKDVLEVLSSM
jgi:hypothetical protein